MALQPMALYEKVIHPAAIGLVDASRVRPIPALIKPGADIKRVYADLSSLGLDPAAELDLDKIGPQIPPFPEMWIETPIPSIEVFGTTVPPMTVGALIRDQGIPDGETCHEAATHVTVDIFAMTTDGRIAFGLGLVLRVRSDGVVEDYFVVRVVDSVDVWSEIHQISMRDLATGQAFAALVAVGLMNCRNVTTERHELPMSRRKKQRRRRTSELDYHTIILPGPRLSGGERGRAHQDVMPQHKVRGHFKTFTADAPLLGKHVGTYWWGWQVRGNKSNGITVTDYKLAPAT